MLNNCFGSRPRCLYTVAPSNKKPRREGEFYFVDSTNESPHFSLGRPGPFAFNGRDRHLPVSHLNMVNEVENTYFGPVVTSFGTVCIYLKHQIRVDVTLDHAIRVINPVAMCKGAIDCRGTTTSLIHPTGRMYQSDAKVQVQSADDRKAKLAARGVTFNSPGSPVVYLLDAGGIRTTVEKFIDLEYDFSVDVFYNGASYGRHNVNECLDAMTIAEHYEDDTGGEAWNINGVRVSQDCQGDVVAQREGGRRVIKTSPNRGTVSVETPLVYASASISPDAHLFVRRGERRIHLNAHVLNAKHGSHSAGLDENGQLVIN